MSATSRTSAPYSWAITTIADAPPESFPGASGARQRAVADQQPAGKAAYRQGGQQDRQHQRPVVEQHAKNRGINRPGDHAADNGLRHQITGARDAQLHPAQAQNETGDQRPQQQRCRQVYS